MNKITHTLKETIRLAVEFIIFGPEALIEEAAEIVAESWGLSQEEGEES